MTLDQSHDPISAKLHPGGAYHYTVKGRILGGIGRGQGHGALDGPIPQRGSKSPSILNQVPMSVVSAGPAHCDRGLHSPVFFTL